MLQDDEERDRLDWSENRNQRYLGRRATGLILLAVCLAGMALAWAGC